MESEKPDFTTNNNVMKKDVPTPAKERKSSNGGLIALTVFSLLIGAAGLAIGIIALLGGLKGNAPVSTASADGYYQGNSVEFEETSVILISRAVS